MSRARKPRLTAELVKEMFSLACMRVDDFDEKLNSPEPFISEAVKPGGYEYESYQRALAVYDFCREWQTVHRAAKRGQQ